MDADVPQRLRLCHEGKRVNVNFQIGRWARRAALLSLGLLLPIGLSAAEPWVVELRSFDAFQARQKQIGKTVGNAMLPMMLVSFAQQRIVKMFGKMRAADPVRWVGFPNGKGEADVVMVYPTVDKVAKMVLNHPAAEKISADTVLLPADEGRLMPTYAVFTPDFIWCAFAPSEELARQALKVKYPVAGGDLFAISCGGASGAFDFDDKGFRFTARTVKPETAARLKGIPFLGELAQGGTTRYITFEDVKKLVTSLASEMAAANGLVKGNK